MCPCQHELKSVMCHNNPTQQKPLIFPQIHFHLTILLSSPCRTTHTLPIPYSPISQNQEPNQNQENPNSKKGKKMISKVQPHLAKEKFNTFARIFS